MHLKHNFKSEAELKDKLDFIYYESSKGKSFHGIMEVAFNEVTIITAIHNIKSNKGSKTAGIDKNKMDTYLQMDKNELLKLIRKSIKMYQPKPVRRIYIPKSNNKVRPLGIPTILDRIIQECLRIILEPIVEAKFYPHSYGFRPYRATKHAIVTVTTLINGSRKNKPIYAIEGDIKGYFDSINHKLLIKKLWRIGVRDKRVIAIINQMLKAGYIEGDVFNKSNTGTVQGGIISPLLANVYLNDFDWYVARMYLHPKRQCKVVENDRKRLKRQGVTPKFLTRYCDDWILLTSTEQEAARLLKHLNKYFKYKLKLDLSADKTILTNLLEKQATFLGFYIKAGKPRVTPQKPNPTNIVGKVYPNKSKLKIKLKTIINEIRKVSDIKTTKGQAIQIEKINSIITGITNYYKTAICSKAFNYIDDIIYKCSNATFYRKYKRNYTKYRVPLDELYNRPQRHKGYKSKTYAIKHEGMNIGITKAFLTHSQWEKRCYNQKMSPYTKEGRELYLKQSNKNKRLPLDRPPLYDTDTLKYLENDKKDNFEFYMNREYAYNRDKGKCKICGCYINAENRHCHRIDEKLALNEINKVKNLAWFCKNCDTYIHGNDIIIGPDNRNIKKIERYRKKL